MKLAGFCPIVKKERISESVYKFIFHSPEIALSANPGQFVQLRTSDHYFPLWPRPFSIYDVDGDKGDFAVIFKKFGCGTSQLTEFEEGESIHVLGPLGNGFDPLEKGRQVAMAGGGIGMPPLYFLAAQSIRDGFPAQNITFISGARSKKDHFDDGGLAELGVNLIICTDDGSYGVKGTVVDILEKDMEKKRIVYACGPGGMLERIDAILTKNKIPGLLSLEALMPCGYGICSGCAVKTIPSANRGPTDDNCDFHLKRVCVDGPVFGAGEVIWG